MKTLSEILRLSGSEIKIYELGRRIHAISESDFYKMETACLPYPAPVQGKARFALCFWQQQHSDTPYIWFLQFPVDELGFINLGCRDQFLDLVLQAMGSNLQQQPDEQQQQALANNPYVFKPTEAKLAYFNARYKYDCSLAASSAYEACQYYLQGLAGWDQWHSLNLQGLADVSARLNQDGNSQQVSKALALLPAPVALKLLEQLEHNPIDQSLSHQLAQLHQQQLEQGLNTASAYLRAMAGSTVNGLLNQAIQHQLQQQPNLDSLLAISARLWPALLNPELLQLFLETLAEQQDQSLFEQVFADLVALAEIRVFVLAQLRSPQTNPALQQAISKLINKAKQEH